MIIFIELSYAFIVYPENKIEIKTKQLQKNLKCIFIEFKEIKT